jgi:MarR family 2-MHQ and catechol resistance regulon transcriptional repressor
MRRHSGPNENKTPLSAFVKLLRSADRVSTDVHRHLIENGLTVSQFGILEALYHLGPLCQKDLGGRILKTAGNITTVITNLEKRGLVTRYRNDEDKRYFTVLLTECGKTLIADIFPRHEQRIVQRMSCLSTEEQLSLIRLCRKLTSGINHSQTSGQTTKSKPHKRNQP